MADLLVERNQTLLRAKQKLKMVLLWNKLGGNKQEETLGKSPTAAGLRRLSMHLEQGLKVNERMDLRKKSVISILSGRPSLEGNSPPRLRSSIGDDSPEGGKVSGEARNQSLNGKGCPLGKARLGVNSQSRWQWKRDARLDCPGSLSAPNQDGNGN